MSKVSGDVNTRRFFRSKPKPPAIVGIGATTSTEVGFVPQLLVAVAREPIYAKVGEYVTLGQRNVKQLADTLDSDTVV